MTLKASSTCLVSEFKPNPKHARQHDPTPAASAVANGASDGWGGSPAAAVVGRAPQFPAPIKLQDSGRAFVGGLAEQGRLGKNDAKNQTIVNVS
jgi:hypothetical protein